MVSVTKEEIKFMIDSFQYSVYDFFSYHVVTLNQTNIKPDVSNVYYFEIFLLVTLSNSYLIILIFYTSHWDYLNICVMTGKGIWLLNCLCDLEQVTSTVVLYIFVFYLFLLIHDIMMIFFDSIKSLYIVLILVVCYLYFYLYIKLQLNKFE